MRGSQSETKMKSIEKNAKTYQDTAVNLSLVLPIQKCLSVNEGDLPFLYKFNHK